MAVPQEILAEVRRRRAKQVSDEALRAAAADAPPDLLGKLGQGVSGIAEVLDIPRNTLARLGYGAMTGQWKDKVSGADILEQFGIRKEPGLSASNVGGFALEVATDPLTYLGGVGAATKFGKGAEALGRAAETAKALSAERKGIRAGALLGADRTEDALRNLAKRSELARNIGETRQMLREGGAPLKLAPTWGEQVAQNQRRAVEVGIPFTDIRGHLPIPYEGQLLQGIQRGGEFLGKLPAVSGIRQAFTREETAGTQARRLAEGTIRRGESELVTDTSKLGREVEDIAKKLGMEPEKLKPLIVQAAETHGVEAKLTAKLRATKSQTKRAQILNDIAKAAGIRSKIPKEALDFGGKMADTFKNLLKTEQAVGRPISELGDRWLNYARRLLTPEGRAWLAKDNFADPVYKKLRALTTETGSEIQRIQGFEGLTIPEINEWARKRDPTFTGQLFSEDPGLIQGFRKLETRQTLAAADYARALVAHAQPALSGPSVPFGKILEAANIDLPELTKLKDHLLPANMANEFLDFSKRVRRPEELKGLMGFLEGVSGVFRKAFTIPWPAYHVRNLESNVVMNWLAKDIYAKHYAEALQIYRDPAKRAEMEIAGVVKGGQTADVTGRSAQKLLKERVYGIEPVGRVQKLLGQVAGKIPGSKIPGALYKGAERIGASVEDISRIAHYLGKKEAGLTDLDAVASVRKWLFDYNDLTDFEKNWVKPLTLFYAYTRKAIPLLVKETISHPARPAGLFRLAGQPSSDRGPLPAWMRGGVAIPAGMDAEGGQRYIQGLGLPIEEFSKFDFTGAQTPFDVAQQGLRNVGQQTAPWLRAGLELAFGKDLFLNKDISEANKAPRILGKLPQALQDALSLHTEKLPSGETRFSGDPQKLWMLRALLPSSRAVQTASRFADPRVGTGEALMNTLTGLRTTSIEPRQELMEAARESVSRRLEQLQREGKVGKFTDFFPKGPKGEKDVESQVLTNFLKRLRNTTRTAGSRG